MYRCALVLLAACGGDAAVRDPATDGAVANGVDAETASADAAADSPTSLTDAMRTACEEATEHSDLTWIEANVLGPTCALMGCHTGVAAVVDLRLDVGFARDNLINRSSSTQTGWERIVIGSPATSYLMVALGRAEGPPPRDGTMPLGAPALCGELLDAIERWIASGAL